MPTTAAHHVANPFALMMNPESVLAAMAGSERLARLESRVCRPLDKPLIAHKDAEAEVDGDCGNDDVEHDD